MPNATARKALGYAFGAMGVLVLAMACFSSSREPVYRPVLSWGRPGDGPGEFHEPIGIAISGGEVFVSESGNNRIQVFDLGGNFLRMFGRGGEGPGELGRPMLMDVRGGRLYVAEYHNDRVQVFSRVGEPLGAIGGSGSGPGEFDSPGGVAVSGDGTLYVADFYNQRVQVLGPDGTFIGQIGRTGEKGVRAGRFNYPTDAALLPGGEVVVADAYNDRVQVFTAGGRFLRKWGGPFAVNIHGPFRGWFKTATAVATGPGGNVFVADFYNHRVQKFTPAGGFIQSIGREGGGAGELRYPTDMATDAAGDLYVVDFGNSRVQKFTQGPPMPETTPAPQDTPEQRHRKPLGRPLLD